MKLTLGVITAVAAFSIAGSASAQETSRLQTIIDRGHIIVGTGSTNPPWHFKDDAGNLVGYDVDMGHLLAKAIFDDPTKVEYVVQSSDSRIPNVLTDKVDITCQFMTVTAGRAQQVDFTILLPRGRRPAHEERQVQELRRHQGRRRRRHDLDPRTSCRGARPPALPDAKVDQYDSVDLIYQALNSAAPTRDRHVVGDAVRRAEPRPVHRGRLRLSPQTYSCALKKGDPSSHFVDIAFREAMTGVTPDLRRLVQEVVRRLPPAPRRLPGELR